MAGIPKREIHAAVLSACGKDAVGYGPLGEVPFRVRLKGLGDLAFYAFTLTSPPGGRPVGEYKIQLIIPGQERGARGRLIFPDGAYTTVLGWSEAEDVFVLWDAYAHETFSYSQNLQVKGESVWLSRVEGLHTAERRLRGTRSVEITVACRRDRLLEAISARLRLSAARLREMEVGT